MLCLVSAGANLALNKQTWQVSTWSPTSTYASSKAVDGDLNTNAATTGTGTLQWWGVDLGTTFNVQGVILYNRQDSCSE